MIKRIVFALFLATSSAKAAPHIDSIVPSTSPHGSSVTISGSGFSTKIGQNTVRFAAWIGSVEALVTSATVSALSVTVPATAITGPVTVRVQGQTSNAFVFTVANLPPAYDFSLSASGPGHVVKGHRLYVLLNLALLAGTRDYVNFSVAGLPAGTAASFPDLEITCCGPNIANDPSPTTLRITTTSVSPEGAFPITVTAVSGGVTKITMHTIHIDPVPEPLASIPIPGFLPIPSLAQWEANMATFGQQHCAFLQDPMQPFDNRLNATYYDAERVYYNIGGYTGGAAWNDCAAAAESIYRDSYVVPNNGTLPGYWNFTAGLRRDFELTGDATSRSAALLLSQNAAYASAGPMYSKVSDARSREIAYATLAYIDAEKVGYPRNAQLEPYIDVILGHFDQWFVSKNALCPLECEPAEGANKYYIQPFMVGLSMEALITYYEEIEPDQRIPHAVKTAVDWLWTHAWYAPGQTFWYVNYISDPAQIPTGYWPPPTTPAAADLNLLIGPAYAWIYRMTGDEAYRDQGDQTFTGSVANAWLGGGKQFNQTYRWSFDFVKWRSGN